MDRKKKFGLALLAFVVLALLSWQTLSNDPVMIHDRSSGYEIAIRFRTATLGIIGLFAALTTLSFWRTTVDERRDSDAERK